MDDAVFLISEAADIARLGLPTARSWVTKGWIGWEGDRLTETAGSPTFLSERTVMAMAIAAKLTVLGVRPQIACQAARSFTDIYDPLEAKGFTREPGKLFKGSRTALLVFPSGDSRVIRTKSQNLEDLLTAEVQRSGFNFLILDMTVKVVELAIAQARKAKA